MEWVIIAGVLVGMLVLPGIAAVVILVTALTSRDRARAVRDADSILAEVFDDSDQVEYLVHRSSVPRDLVIVGAEERGYVLADEGSASSGGTVQMLRFRRASA
ncbi:hypothetical protein [Brachybacterium hainanense]|uniref:Uncharacterized protein n=1 Tax=Brachybacterium hainanense TaxID=1541174 RepID=A0ABV6RCE1_9MICO